MARCGSRRGIIETMSFKKAMSLILLIAAAIVFVVALVAWWHLFFGMPNPPLRQGSVTVAQSSIPAASGGTAASGTVSTAPGADQIAIDGVTFNVEIASTTLEETRGLSYRTSLGPNDGMLFIFPIGAIQTFWMKDMNFPLDMIWISGSTIVGATEDIPAPASGTPLWSLPVYSSPPSTDKVLEVNAGTVAKYHIKVGDTVTMGPY